MKRTTLVFCFMFGGLFGSADAQGILQDWKTAKECTEYLPKTVCRVTIPIADVSRGANPAPTHPDVTIRPNGIAGVVLQYASPLMTCAIAESPAPLTRDVTTSVTTFLGTLATIGLPGSNPALQLYRVRNLPGTAGVDARKIDVSEEALEMPQRNYEQALADYRQANATVTADWKYSYPDDAHFAAAASDMYRDLRTAFEDPLPSGDDWKTLSQSVESTAKALDTFRVTYADGAGQFHPADCNGDTSCYQEFQSWYESAQSRLSNSKSTLKVLPAHVQFLNDLQALLKPGFTWLNSNSTQAGSRVFTPDAAHPWTTIYLPMSSYAQKQVTEAITCKDVASQAQAFDAITFTAYYEPAASWDLSAAAFISLVPGRQVGPISGSQPAGTTTLTVTSQSSVQFIPGAVFEIHPSHLNFRCPWANDGTGYHPWGYVCSIGPAGGFLVNPNNGTTAAEFFEGISFGIDRLAILIGNHTGRSQEFGEGYQIGQTVPTGTMPPTVRRWTNHPAIGIAFRIPIR
jgi:hypothetical protein